MNINTLTMNFTNEELKLSMPMRGSMPSKPYWLDMKQKYLPGSGCVGSLLSLDSLKN